MSMTGNKFRLGLFFSIGILFTIFLIFWLSGGLNEKRTTTYVSYLSWSVQGLSEQIYPELNSIYTPETNE